MAVKERGAPLTGEELRVAAARLVEGLRAGDPAELANALFRDDGEFAAAVLEALPRLVSTAAQAVRAFAEALESLPAEKSAELMASAHARIDGAEISRAVNALSRLIIRMHEERPDLLPETRAETLSEFMQATDFGKLRKAVTYKAGERLDLLRREVEILGDNPMALINIFSVVAPVVNDALPVLVKLFEILALPAEAVTYALFKILQDIEWEDVAAIINGAAAFIVNIHRGSLILGDGSLYTRGPFQRIGSDLVSALDGQVLAEAIAALGEEAEAFAGALAGKVLENEGLALPLFESMVAVANSFFLFASSVLEKANALPREALGRMAASLAEDLEVGELGRAVTSLVDFNRKMIAENPGLVAALSRKALSALGMEVSPEAAARGFNRALAAYNHWAGAHPDLLAERTDAFLAGLDTHELEMAARSASGQVAQALSRHPEVLKALFKTALSLVCGSARGYLRGLRGRVKARRG
ncbi:MAG: hypothetical protein QME88_05220 [Actinomycetota bacterium]|nr:hypothetical protein [Actinomycetota bacterium]